MSGLLHPQGPEPARTYWIRRGILLAVVLVLIVLVVLGVRSLTRSVVATAPAPTITPPAVTSSTPATTPATSITPGSSTTPTHAAGSSANPTLSGAGTPAASAGSAASTSTASAKTRSTATPTPDCAPARLRVTLKGDRRLSPGEKNTFTLSVVNTGKVTCLASVTDKNFELKIYSGTDRIWSSKDCAKVLTDFDKKLAAGADFSWKMTWNGKRSAKGKSCKVGSPNPLPGTYWATAQLAGAKPVQLAMIIS